MENLGELIKKGEAVIVDVRTPQEFMGGNVAGSVNIPLNEVPYRMEEFKEMKKVVLCCASGSRSMQATSYLKQNGIDCMNGGSWMEVNYHIQ